MSFQKNATCTSLDCMPISHRHILPFLPILFFAVLGSSLFLRPHMVWATISYACLVYGFLVRKKHLPTHMLFMTLGIALDLILVLVLQVQRNAIDTAVHLRMTPLQMCHVFSSTLATVFYLPTLYCGFKMRQPALRKSLRRKHLTVAVPALFFRTLGFLFMFSLLSRVSG